MILLLSYQHRMSVQPLLILYDQPQLQGLELPLTESAPNLAAIGFECHLQNFSCSIVRGTWELYSGANYQGLLIMKAISGTRYVGEAETDPVVNSVRLVPPPPPATSEIVLYKHARFTSPCRYLTDSCADLGDFNNATSSIRVISGIWELYSSTNYGGSRNPPTVTGPGHYNISQMLIRNDQLSSVKLIKKTSNSPATYVAHC